MEYQMGGIATDFLSQEERVRLVGLCRKLTGSVDAAEDLAQETLLLAWRRIEGLREPEKRTQWIAGIARNLSCSRAVSRRPTSPRRSPSCSPGASTHRAASKPRPDSRMPQRCAIS